MKHPLQCPECGDFRYIEYIGIRFEEENKGFGVKLPSFQCKSCGQHNLRVPYDQLVKFKEDIMPTIDEGEFIDMELKFIFSKLDPQRKFTHYDHLDFDYDSRDYYVIPGLYRENDDGYLTPVFFDKDVLLYYNNHPDYSVKLYSFSSGNIYYKGEEMFKWGFGINRSGKIFMWLGDLSEDFEEDETKSHLKRFQASNVPSDHDLVSKFYFSQNPFSTKDAFQKSDNEYKLFRQKEEFEHRIKSKMQVNLSKLDIDAVLAYYKHPILDDRNQIFEAYLKLDKLLIENIEQTEIRKYLLANGLSKTDLEKDGKPFRSLKLFTVFIEGILKQENADEIVTPLFVLNDLRQLHGHLSNTSFDKRYASCKERLGSSNDVTDLDFFMVVVTSLIKMYQILNSTMGSDE